MVVICIEIVHHRATVSGSGIVSTLYTAVVVRSAEFVGFALLKQGVVLVTVLAVM